MFTWGKRESWAVGIKMRYCRISNALSLEEMARDLLSLPPCRRTYLFHVVLVIWILSFLLHLLSLLPTSYVLLRLQDTKNKTKELCESNNVNTNIYVSYSGEPYSLFTDLFLIYKVCVRASVFHTSSSTSSWYWSSSMSSCWSGFPAIWTHTHTRK